MQLVMRDPRELISYEDNPRNNDKAVEHIAQSIRKYGFRNPILVNENDLIIAGETRKKAAILLKLKEVPCILESDMTPEQVRAYRIADNRLNEIADWNPILLKNEIEALKSLDIDISSMGFSDQDIESLFEECARLEDRDQEIVEDDFDPEPPEEPVTREGDIYLLGRHRLMCGDARSSEDIACLMDGAKAKLLLTDPPYNVDYVGKTEAALKIENDNMTPEEYRRFLFDAFSAVLEVIEPGAAFYIWHADSKGYDVRSACHDAGMEIRQCLIWAKNSLVVGRQDYQWQHEPCLYGWKDGAAHTWQSDRCQSTLLEFDRPTRNEDHPTMKPVKMFDYQIRNNTKKGDIVLDDFAGSGTTCIACEQNGRTAYMLDNDPKYCDVIVRRWEEFTGQKAELIRK